jgi:phosphoribosylanthranilate isomerase
LECLAEVQKIINSELPVYALDLNSKFESRPGAKKIEELKEFKNRLALNR